MVPLSDLILIWLGYRDADIAGSLTDRKSTSGMCQMLGMFTCFLVLQEEKLRSF